MTTTEDLQRLIRNHYRTLQKLKEKEASFGPLHTPAYILNEIEDIEAEIARLENEINVLALNVPSSTQASSIEDALRLLKVGNGWPIFMSENFENKSNPWLEGKYTFSNLTNSFTIENNFLYWEMAVRNRAESWNLLGHDIAPRDDFFLRVEAQRVDGPETSSYGLVFRSSAGEEHEHYSFRISDTQNFIVTARYEGKIINVISWTRALPIEPNIINNLIVIGQGTNYFFFVNGSFVGSIDNDLLLRGQLGLCVYLERIDQKGVFRFRNFEVRTPSGH